MRKYFAMFVKMDNAQKINNPIIQCKSVEWKQLYVGANGNVAPCCWLELEWRTPNDPGRNNYVDVIRDFPNLKQQSLEEIFESGYFNRIKETWTNSPLNECARQCGVFDRLREQY